MWHTTPQGLCTTCQPIVWRFFVVMGVVGTMLLAAAEAGAGGGTETAYRIGYVAGKEAGV